MANVRERLKAGTLDLHQQAERHLAPLMRPGLDEATYAGILERFHDFYQTFESEMANRRDSSAAAAFYEGKAKRTERLRADLRAFGREVSGVSVPLEFMAHESDASLWGMVYVVQGSSLGGQVISAAVRKSLNRADGRGFSFFEGDGAETGANWRRFLEVLERSVPESEIDRAVDGANRLFAALNQVFKAGPPEWVRGQPSGFRP